MTTNTAPVKLQVFKSTIPYMNFIFPNGKAAVFQNGVFRTAIVNEAEHLDYEISQGHPHIFRDPVEREVMSDEVDPMVVLRKKHFAEFLAEQQRALDPTKVMGSTENVPLIPASTSSVSSMMAGSASPGEGVQTFAVNPAGKALAASLVAGLKK